LRNLRPSIQGWSARARLAGEPRLCAGRPAGGRQTNRKFVFLARSAAGRSSRRSWSSSWSLDWRRPVPTGRLGAMDAAPGIRPLEWRPEASGPRRGENTTREVGGPRSHVCQPARSWKWSGGGGGGGAGVSRQAKVSGSSCFDVRLRGKVNFFLITIGMRGPGSSRVAARLEWRPTRARLSARAAAALCSRGPPAAASRAAAPVNGKHN